MKKLLSILFLFPFIFSFNHIYAQRDQELGVFVGISQYQGDLSAQTIDPRVWHPIGGILYRYNFNPRLDLRIDASYTELSGADSLATKSTYARNLSFKTRLIDASIQLEYNLLPFISGHRKKNWTPYIFAGLCVFNFDPQALYKGTWYRLQPLGTEGQGMINGGPKYSLVQIGIPFGLGVKYSFKNSYKKRTPLAGWVVGMEFTLRKTFTDHLDDVGGYYPASPDVFNGDPIKIALSDRTAELNGGQPQRFYPNDKRGNPNLNDWYGWLAITITKTIRPNRCFSF